MDYPKKEDDSFFSPGENGTVSGSGSLHTEDATTDINNEDTNVARRSRACENCRALKVRCIPSDPDRPEEPCTRCLKRKKQCTFHVGPRKRSRKSDARVASLEKKIQLLSAQLISQKDGESSPDLGFRAPISDTDTRQKRPTSPSSGPGSTQSPLSAVGSDNTPFNRISKTFHSSTYHPSLNGTPESLGLEKDVTKNDDAYDTGISVDSMREELARAWNRLSDKCATRMRFLDDKSKEPPRMPTLETDVISRGIIKRENAERRLHMYKDLLYQFHPVIALPDLSFDALRRELPILFLTIMSTCSIADTDKDRDNIEAHYILHNFAYETVIYQAMVAGAKTFELLQSILLLTFWCNEPDFYHHHKSHLLVNLAASVAADLGIGGMVISSRHISFKYDGIVFPEVLVNPKTDECRRMWLHVYCASMNMINVIRRPKFYLWTDYTKECCDVLYNSSGAPSYKRIVYYTRLTRVSEDIGCALYATGSKKPPSLTDVRTRYLIAHFEERLRSWSDDFQAEQSYDSAFMPYYCTIQMFLYQAVIYQEFSEKIGRSPFSDFSLAFFRGEMTLDEVDCTVKLADATITCIKVFMSFSPQSMAIFPVFQYSRLVFCVSMILKLRLLALSNVHFRKALPLNAEHFNMIFQIIEKLNRVEEEYPFSNSCCCYNFVIKLLLCHFDRQARYQREIRTNPAVVVDNADGVQVSQYNGDSTVPYGANANSSATPSLAVPVQYPLHQPPSPLDMLSNVATRHGSIEPPRGAGPYQQVQQQPQPQQPQGQGSNGFQYIGNDQDDSLWLMGADFWKELIPSVEAFTSYDI